MFSMAMGMITVVAPLQILAGDQHGLNTLEHQPVKVMAMEGHFESHARRRAAGPVRLARPGSGRDALRRRDSQGLVADPEALARCAAQGPRHGRPQGLAAGRRSCSGPSASWSGLGIADAGAGAAAACWRASRHRLYDWPLLHRLALAMGPAGFVAVIAGWVTTEVGRQPYTVLRPAAHRRLGLAARRRRRWRPRCWPSSSSTSSCSAPASSTSCA